MIFDDMAFCEPTYLADSEGLVLCVFVSVAPAEPTPVSPDVISPVVEVKAEKQKPVVVLVEETRPQQKREVEEWQRQPEGDDDWFTLFADVREEPIIVPPGTVPA